MSNSLVVITFGTSDRAPIVFEALRAMRKKRLYDLDATMVVTRDHRGKARPLQTGRTEPEPEATINDILTVVWRLTCLWLPEADCGPVTDGRKSESLANTLSVWGVDVEFFRAVARALPNDSSAIFFMLGDQSIGDVDEIVHVLSLFHGTVHRTRISAQAAARMQELFWD